MLNISINGTKSILRLTFVIVTALIFIDDFASAATDANVSANEPTEKPVATKADEIRNSRWVTQPSTTAPRTSNNPSAEQKVSFGATCTDSTGTTHLAKDSGYDLCMQQAAAHHQAPRTSPSVDQKTKPKSSDPTAGAGFQMHFGK